MKKILIVEDDDAIRKALVDDFTFEGFSVDSAAMGNVGLKKAFDPDIDIILLDLMLPEIDGFEICKELRKNGIETPIIMLTAKSAETFLMDVAILHMFKILTSLLPKF